MLQLRSTFYEHGQSPCLIWLFVFFSFSSSLFLGLSKRFGIDHYISQGVPDPSWCIDGSRNKTADKRVLSSLSLFFSFERDTFFWKPFSLLFFLPWLFCIFLLSSISFLSVFAYFSFLTYIDGKWGTGRCACVHRTSYGRAHRLSTLVGS